MVILVYATIMLALASLARAGSADQLAPLLDEIRGNQALTATEKAEKIGGFIKHFDNRDTLVLASLLQQCYLITGPSSVKASVVEAELLRLGGQRPNSWEFKFAQFSLLNLYHLNGRHSRVVEIGETMLSNGYFEVFDKGSDLQLVLLRKAYPVTAENMLTLVLTQLTVAHDMLGNTFRAKEVRALISNPPHTNNQPKLNTPVSTPAQVAEGEHSGPKSIQAKVAVPRRWNWALGGFVILAAILVAWRVIKGHKR